MLIFKNFSETIYFKHNYYLLINKTTLISQSAARTILVLVRRADTLYFIQRALCCKQRRLYLENRENAQIFKKINSLKPY